MNNFIVIGNLAKDPWVSSSGAKMELTVAVNRGYSKRQEVKARQKDIPIADFFAVTVFRSNFSDKQFEWIMSLRKAHIANDKAVMAAYGFSAKMSEEECVAKLMEMYQNLTGE